MASPSAPAESAACAAVKEAIRLARAAEQRRVDLQSWRRPSVQQHTAWVEAQSAAIAAQRRALALVEEISSYGEAP